MPWPLQRPNRICSAFELTAESGSFRWKQTHGSDQSGSGAIPFIKEKGSFTLVSGILNDDPIIAGVAASTVSGALEAFVRLPQLSFLRDCVSMW